jgi:hypothetical protein
VDPRHACTPLNPSHSRKHPERCLARASSSQLLQAKQDAPAVAKTNLVDSSFMQSPMLLQYSSTSHPNRTGLAQDSIANSWKIRGHEKESNCPNPVQFSDRSTAHGSHTFATLTNSALRDSASHLFSMRGLHAPLSRPSIALQSRDVACKVADNSLTHSINSRQYLDKIPSLLIEDEDTNGTTTIFFAGSSQSSKEYDAASPESKLASTFGTPVSLDGKSCSLASAQYQRYLLLISFPLQDELQ